MRILHIITRLDKGGSADVVLNLVAGLKNMGHEVFLATGPTLDPHTDLSAFSDRTAVPVSHIKYLRRTPHPLFDFLALFEILKIIKKIRPDVLHTHTSKAGFIGRIAGRIAGTRAIVHMPHGHVFYGYFNTFASRLFLFLERAASYFGDRIITLTEIEKKEYVSLHIESADNIIAIPCGIDLESFQTNTGNMLRAEFGIPGSTKVIGWVGRLEPIKGCEFFIKACQLIKKEIPDAKFLVVGDGPLNEEMKALSYSCGLNNNLLFLGFRKDIPAIMNSIDLLLHTPLNEGLGRVLLEAMACAKPVVATRVGGIPEIIGHEVNGLLVPPEDHIAMACESVRVLMDDTIAEKLGRAGREKASIFSTGHMVKQIFSLYRELIAVLLVIVFQFIPGGALYAMEKIPGVVHLDTNISDGTLSPEHIINIAKKAGMKVAITTDKDNQHVQYGIPPLRKIAQKTEERQSVRTYGAKNYLDLIDNIGKKNPDMSIIAGLEAVPFYYWQGSYFNRDLKLMNFHKHLLIIGLEKPEDIKGIPAVCCNNPVLFNWQCLLNAWPLLLLPAGLWLALNKKTGYLALQQLVVKKDKRPYLIPGVIILLSGLIFTINNIPFCGPLYDQYHGDRGALPYQTFIDYVEGKGGMVFWAHPDVDSRFKLDQVEINTPPYSDELIRTSNYTGFAVLLEGMKFTGKPGGVWDTVLKQYIRGERKKPVWAIGELDYKEGNWMGETQTVFLVNINNKAEILDAMRKGRMYAVSGEPKPVLDAFQVWDDKNNNWVEMGGTATAHKEIKIKISASLPSDKKASMKLKLIREGVVIKELPFENKLDTELTDDYPEKGKKTYYRVDIDGKLISNPIFVNMEQT